MCIHNLYFEKKQEKEHFFFHLKIIFFTAFKNHCKLHRHVCVMLNSPVKRLASDLEVPN